MARKESALVRLLRDLREAGLTLGEAARLVALTRPPADEDRLTKKEKRKLLREGRALMREGLSVEESAAVLGIEVETFNTWLDGGLGIERRHREFEGEDLELLMDPEIAALCAMGMSLERVKGLSRRRVRMAVGELRMGTARALLQGLRARQSRRYRRESAV